VIEPIISPVGRRFASLPALNPCTVHIVSAALNALLAIAESVYGAGAKARRARCVWRTARRRGEKAAAAAALWHYVVRVVARTARMRWTAWSARSSSTDRTTQRRVARGRRCELRVLGRQARRARALYRRSAHLSHYAPGPPPVPPPVVRERVTAPSPTPARHPLWAQADSCTMLLTGRGRGLEGAAQIYRARSVDRSNLFMKINCVMGGRTATPARFPRPATPVEDMACASKQSRAASLTEASFSPVRLRNSPSGESPSRVGLRDSPPSPLSRCLSSSTPAPLTLRTVYCRATRADGPVRRDACAHR
jgi:hypothetical protein